MTLCAQILLHTVDQLHARSDAAILGLLVVRFLKAQFFINQDNLDPTSRKGLFCYCPRVTEPLQASAIRSFLSSEVVLMVTTQRILNAL